MDRVMSKRLRASMRAANKGRNLRPRSSQLPSPPTQVDEQEAANERESTEPEQIVAAEAPAPSPTSADLRDRETVREPVVAAEDEKREDEPAADSEAPIALVALSAK